MHLCNCANLFAAVGVSQANVLPMRSTMMDLPLTVSRILEFGRTNHAATEVTTWTPDGPEVSTFGAIGARAAAFANALVDELGIDGDQRIGTMMYNCSEHLEVFLGVTSMGAVFQPLNKQLMPDQITHIINHSEDEVIVADPRLLRMLVRVLPDCPTVRAVVFIGVDETLITEALAALPEGVTGYRYEVLLDGRSTVFDWPTVDENTAAAICYSTGTLGAPKGVAYSHRSLYLQSLELRTDDSYGITNGEKWLCCVPIYHVLSWGVPLAAFMSGAPMVFPGADLSARRLSKIIATDMPQKAQGVPTIWTQLLVHYLNNPPSRMSLQEILVGGSPVPPALIRNWENLFGVDIVHLWGMTETSPVGTVARPPVGVSGETRWKYRVSQGRFSNLLEFRIVDEKGKVLDQNDRNQGELQVRGQTVTGHYLHSATTEAGGDAATFRDKPVTDAEEKYTADGWLRTGDVGSITPDGYLTIHDRSRDVIRSGGEWIFSVQLENLITESKYVVECAVIGYPDATWGERPLAVTVLLAGVEPSKQTAEALREELRDKLPSWMLPEYWAFVDSIDKTSVDKFDKVDLRGHLSDGTLDVIKLKGPGEK